MDRPERHVVISGVGRSDVGRRLYRSGLSLTLEAATNAVRDAGLEFSDIDGIATFPGAVAEPSPGFAGADLWDVLDALRLRVNWHHSTFQGPGQGGAIFSAILAVSAGLCRHALVYRTVTESTGQGAGPRRAQFNGEDDVGAPYDWLMATGAMSPVNWLAFYVQRYMQVYGLTRDQLGWVPVVQRRHASRNPAAVLREPFTIDEYLSARMISEPLCLLDCDLPVDAATAFIVSARSSSRDLRAPIAIQAISTALGGRAMWEQWEDLTTMSTHIAGPQLWSRADLRPDDVDFVQLYDGFSFVPLMWLEGLGFCGRGEAGDFVAGGKRIDLDGELPMNTSGGQLSAGRLHGFGVLAEAVDQIRGEAGARQLRRHEVAVAGIGGGVMSGALLLTTER